MMETFSAKDEEVWKKIWCKDLSPLKKRYSKPTPIVPPLLFKNQYMGHSYLGGRADTASVEIADGKEYKVVELYYVVSGRVGHWGHGGHFREMHPGEWGVIIGTGYRFVMGLGYTKGSERGTYRRYEYGKGLPKKYEPIVNMLRRTKLSNRKF